MNHESGHLRRSLLALLCTAPLVLSSCGGGGSDGDSTSSDDDGSQRSDSQERDRDDDDEDSDGGTGTGGGGGEPQPPTFKLTGDLEVSDGWVEVPARCTSAERSGPPYFSYHAPAEWTLVGGGAGGSGGVGGNGDHRYSTPSGDEVWVDAATDSYEDGEVLNASREPWTSWDYEITTYEDGEDVVTEVTYDELDPVTIDGETFDFWFVEGSPEGAFPSWSTEYKLRAVFAEVPEYRDVRRPESATLTIFWDGDDRDEGVARSILESFRLADCAQEAIVESYEMITGSDWSD